MASAFEHFYAQLNGIRIHFVQVNSCDLAC